MRTWIATAGAVLAVGVSASTATAQRPESKVIDTEALVIKPTDTATTMVGRSFQYVSRAVAATVDNNALIRTVNNLFGKRAQAAPTQPGLSPLPDPKQYPTMPSVLKPELPKYQTITLPQSSRR